MVLLLVSSHSLVLSAVVLLLSLLTHWYWQQWFYCCLFSLTGTLSSGFTAGLFSLTGTGSSGFTAVSSHPLVLAAVVLLLSLLTHWYWQLWFAAGPFSPKGTGGSPMVLVAVVALLDFSPPQINCR